MAKREGNNQGKNKKGGVKASSQKLKARVLKSYYGNPMKDMKLIAITGSTGKVEVAHYVHGILKVAGEQVAVLASDQPFRMGVLHKFLSDAWKAGANYVVITVPAETLRDNVFYGIPVTVAAMTNFTTHGLHDMEPDDYLNNEKTLFSMKPEIVVLNKDDLNYGTFSDFKGERKTITFGEVNTADIKVINSKLYNKGVEATLSLGSEIVTVATFLPGEMAVSYMACAAAIANSLEIKPEFISDGIAEYEPDK